MAAQKPAAAKTETTPAEPGTETQTTPVEQDVAEQTAAAAALAAAEPQADPRTSALASLVFGKGDPVIAPEDEPAVDESNVQNFGGRSRAVVLFSRYNQIVDGEFKQARKGAVIDTDADALARGIRIGALRKLKG